MDDETRRCEYCGLPLEDDAHVKRKYHKEFCSEAVHRENTLIYLQTHREQHKATVNARAIRKRIEARYKHRDPLKRLGMDYVELKLAGKIHIPRRQKQIRLKPRKYK